MEISGLTIADLKNKIKTIRTMYKKEHSLVCKSIKSGMGTEELYVPKLFWYKRADIFRNGVTNTRVTSSNLNLQSDDAENEAETQDENVFPASTSASVTVENGNTQKDAMHSEKTETANQSTKKQSKTTNVFCVPLSRKRKISGNENISTICAAIDKLDEVVQRNKSNVDDEFDIFAKYIAVQLKQMPLYDAIICQEQIESVIRQKRLQAPCQYQNTPSPAFSPSQYHSSPSPSLSNNMDGEYWSSSVSNQLCDRQQCGEDLQESSNIVTEALKSVLD
ncbi:uncharacterized protein [Onthophagus taurus]|uniref:uncharacterized protein n=1 Tax=Onthophagus taurus TaxID=166361 RepID=UPI0039BDE28A